MPIFRVLGWVLLMFVAAIPLFAQPPAESNPPLPIIADEPKTIDPGDVLAPQLAAAATHDFSDSSLREVVAWLQTEQRLVVLLDKKALAALGVTAAEPVSDHFRCATLSAAQSPPIDRARLVLRRRHFVHHVS
jgi:hypothetical protein